ncbi:AraC family transcriptional regulator [Nonomuraea rubra]|uniref:AraC-like DNA-binding protein n=1 Tax=Nonomuraea rubra TaxID=46180 RepID=A0A7X0NTE6_9ACTN|nr:AraC family transcriptional regulator [Nonomuraea rubra]MBB6549293.1 AraC-like DNA-binding protein [Nonomuraea rubra]
MSAQRWIDFRDLERRITLGPIQVVINPRLPLEADDGYQILVPLTGRMCGGQVVVHDAVTRGGAAGLLEGAVARVPKALLPLPQEPVERLLGRGLPDTGGVGALLRRFVADLVDEQETLRPADGPRLGMVLLDLLTAFLAVAAEAPDGPDGGTVVPPDPRAELTLRIRAYIKEHLPDPELGPRSVAAAHHISVSYLHRLFQDAGTTVAAWIRGLRLDRARRDLTDPVLLDLPVYAIAGRWGFVNPADFSRAFRARYGLPPKEFRLKAVSPRPVA